MAHIVYLGDEVTAAGFRLAGLETRVVSPAEVAATLRDVRAGGDAECVLLSGSLVDYVPAAELDAALSGDSPLLGLVPDILGQGAPPDLGRQVRNALGIDA